MADNQTNKYMKNVILTHKELQLNLFLAVTYGLSAQQPEEDIHIYSEIKESEYQWVATRHPTAQSCAVNGKPVFYYQINKGDHEMNDVRLGVTVCYLRDHAEKFLLQLKEFLKK